jgi:hypothetical protein
MRTMTRRSLLATMLASLAPSGSALACTEVIHGSGPQWKSKITSHTYSCFVEGHYTETHDLTAAGVKTASFVSRNPSEKMAELLGLRTAFLDFFLSNYQQFGGTRDEAIEQVQDVVDAWRNNTKCVVTETGQQQVPR